MPKRTTRYLMLGLAMLYTGAVPADDKDIPIWLTGGTNREWVLERWEAVLDSSGACTHGELWTFHSNGQVEKKRCLNGTASTETAHWHPSAPGEFNTRVAIGGRTYEVEPLLREEPPKAGLPPTITRITKLREIRQQTDAAVQELTLTHREF